MAVKGKNNIPLYTKIAIVVIVNIFLSALFLYACSIQNQVYKYMLSGSGPLILFFVSTLVNIYLFVHYSRRE